MITASPEDGTGWFWVCVEDLANGVIQGTVQNQYQREPFLFSGLDQFLEIAEMSMDIMAAPRRDIRRRKFSAAHRQPGAELEEELVDLPVRCCAAGSMPQNFVVHYGRYGVFNIRVLYRRNASWQGEATYFDRRHKSSLVFRSTLELVCAMRQTLAARADASDWEEEFMAEEELCIQ